MRDRSDKTGGPLWTRGDMMFRVHGSGRESDRIIKIRRPFALVGQTAETDIGIADPSVSARHVYLHLDPRGVYVVDLVTRTGTRIKGTDQMVGWIRPGDWFEVAGRRLELLRVRIGGAKHNPPPCDADLLAETGPTPLVGVTLEPQRPADCPWVLGSELVFLGWSSSCGIQVRDSSIARTHCALVRTPSAAYIVDLWGHHTVAAGKPVRGAAILNDGDFLTLGSSPFRVRIEPASAVAPRQLQIETDAAATHDSVPITVAVSAQDALSRFEPDPERDPSGALVPQVVEPSRAYPLETVPAHSQRELLAWMMGTIQGGQGEVLRQQGEFQMAMTQLLRQIQQDNATLLNAHLARIESVDRELAALRTEIERRNLEPPPAPPSAPVLSPARALPMPRINHPIIPLRIVRKVPEPSRDPQGSTTWLLERVTQLETENRSAWKDLLGRLTAPRRSS